MKFLTLPPSLYESRQEKKCWKTIGVRTNFKIFATKVLKPSALASSSLSATWKKDFQIFLNSASTTFANNNIMFSLKRLGSYVYKKQIIISTQTRVLKVAESFPGKILRSQAKFFPIILLINYFILYYLSLPSWINPLFSQFLLSLHYSFVWFSILPVPIKPLSYVHFLSFSFPLPLFIIP